MNNLLAAFMFFTRLPFWRIKRVPDECFRNVVHYWVFAGLLTGGVMAGVLWCAAAVLPYPAAVLLAIASRVLLTGALHEDGLADFFDGFGGGATRERVLAIMKDSHIGSYGVIGLILYYLLLGSLLLALPMPLTVPVILSGDIVSKFIASQVVNVLPYARKEQESKAGVIYNRIPAGVALLHGVLVAGMLYWLLPLRLLWAVVPVLFLFLLLTGLMRRKIEGYTGDCCGALFLLCELMFYLSVHVLWKFI